LQDDDNLLTETQIEIPRGIKAPASRPGFDDKLSQADKSWPQASETAEVDDFNLSSEGLNDLLQAARDVIQSNRTDDLFKATAAHHKRTKKSRVTKVEKLLNGEAEQQNLSQSSARLRAQKLDAAALLRNENLAERRALGSAQDLLSANPHLGTDNAPLLKSSHALPKRDPRRPDIHERITDTGTDPRIKFPSPSIMPHTMEAQAVALAIRENKEKQKSLPTQKKPQAVPKQASKPMRRKASALPELSQQQRAAQNKLELSNLREDWDPMASDFDEAETAANPELYSALHSSENKSAAISQQIKKAATDFVDDEATIADELSYKTLDELNPEDFEETAAGKDPRQALLQSKKNRKK